MLQKIDYYDFTIALPYPIGGDNKRNTKGFKIPAQNLFQAFFYLQMLGIDLKIIVGVSQFENVKRSGRTVYTYKLKRVFDGVELSTCITTYKRIHKKKFLKEFT